MSDYDDDEHECDESHFALPEEQVQIQDLVGIGLTLLAGCLQEAALATHATAEMFYSSGSLRRTRSKEIRARRDAAQAMGLLGTQEPRDG